MKRRVKLFFLRLTVFTLQRDKGISKFFLSLWKKHKPEKIVHPQERPSLLKEKLSLYSHVQPTNPTSMNYNIMIEEGYLKPTIGVNYTKRVLLKSMTSNP